MANFGRIILKHINREGGGVDFLVGDMSHSVFLEKYNTLGLKDIHLMKEKLRSHIIC